MSLQVSEMRTALKRDKHDISDIDDVPGTFLQWCNFANKQIYNYLIGIENTRFIQTQSYTILNGVYALPDMLTFRGLGLGFFLNDDNGNATDQHLPQTGYGSGLQGYYLVGNNVYFTGFPTAKTGVLRYIPLPVELDSEDDFFTLDGTENGIEIVPSFYKQALLNDLEVLYAQWDQDLGMEGVSDFRFSRTLSDLQQFYPRSPRAKSVPFYNSAY